MHCLSNWPSSAQPSVPLSSQVAEVGTKVSSLVMTMAQSVLDPSHQSSSYYHAKKKKKKDLTGPARPKILEVVYKESGPKATS